MGKLLGGFIAFLGIGIFALPTKSKEDAKKRKSARLVRIAAAMFTR